MPSPAGSLCKNYWPGFQADIRKMGGPFFICFVAKLLAKKTNHGSRNKRVRTELKSNCHNSTTTSNKFCCPQWVWWRTGFDACFNLQLLVHVDEAEPLTLTRTRWSLSTWWSTLKIISSDHSVAFMLPRNWFFPDKHTSALLPYWSMHRILGWHVWLRTTW